MLGSASGGVCAQADVSVPSVSNPANPATCNLRFMHTPIAAVPEVATTTSLSSLATASPRD